MRPDKQKRKESILVGDAVDRTLRRIYHPASLEANARRPTLLSSSAILGSCSFRGPVPLIGIYRQTSSVGINPQLSYPLFPLPLHPTPYPLSSLLTPSFFPPPTPSILTSGLDPDPPSPSPTPFPLSLLNSPPLSRCFSNICRQFSTMPL